VNRRILTRKDYIIERILDNAKVSLQMINGKNEYVISENPIQLEEKTTEMGTIITKTEYDFARYLINNNIIKQEQATA